jgi:hypothetical protein
MCPLAQLPSGVAGSLDSGSDRQAGGKDITYWKGPIGRRSHCSCRE